MWRCQIPWNWRHRQLWVATWVLRIEPRSAGGAVSALNYSTISPAPSPRSFMALVYLFFAGCELVFIVGHFPNSVYGGLGLLVDTWQKLRDAGLETWFSWWNACLDQKAISPVPGFSPSHTAPHVSGFVSHLWSFFGIRVFKKQIKTLLDFFNTLNFKSINETKRWII